MSVNFKQIGRRVKEIRKSRGLSQADLAERGGNDMVEHDIYILKIDDEFKDKAGVFSAREIGRTAKERKAGSLGYAEAMLIAYNKKMKSALRWSKLYSNKSDLPYEYTDCV